MQCVCVNKDEFAGLILTGSLLTGVCCVGRADKAEHSPGIAGCSLPSSKNTNSETKDYAALLDYIAKRMLEITFQCTNCNTKTFSSLILI